MTPKIVLSSHTSANTCICTRICASARTHAHTEIPSVPCGFGSPDLYNNHAHKEIQFKVLFLPLKSFHPYIFWVFKSLFVK